jgi:hypothetical protein
LKTEVCVLETVKPTILDAKVFIMLFQLKLLKGDNTLSQRRLTPSETRFLQEVLSADRKIVNIRLREGEYQYSIAEAIAFFQLELYFPDVKDIIKKLYGEEKTNDIQFIRKIQTILKKMEKSNIVRILPKKEPWELQRYALSSFKFQDVDKNLVVLATDQQIKQIQNVLHSILSQQETPTAKLSNIKTKICVLLFIVIASYMAILWNFMQPTITPIIFILAFSIAVICSLMLGKILSQG